MTHGSLFSGVGGFDLAAEWMGWENLFHCEINEWCQKVLRFHFPKSIQYDDITRTDFTPWRGKVDVLTGGFPCQPFSVAGQRKGQEDDRYLWPEMLRAIREIRPAWVIGENVAGIISMVQPGSEVTVESQASLFDKADKETLLEQEYVIETVCRDLEREGYSVQPILIPACGVGAPHRRDRVWFVACKTLENTGNVGCLGQKVLYEQQGRAEPVGASENRASCFREELGKTIANRSYTGIEGLRQERENEIHGRESTSHSNGTRFQAKGSEQQTTGITGGGLQKDATDTYGEKLQTWLKITDGRSRRKISQGWTMELNDLAVSGLLLTPTMRDYQPSVSPAGLVRKNGRRRDDALCNIPVMIGQHCQQNDGKTSQLNPLFVEEMMGYPLMWTTLPFLSQNGDKSQ